MSIIEKINELETEKLVTFVVAGCFALAFLSVTTCSIHMNTYNAGEAKSEASENIARINASKAETLADIEVSKQENAGEIALANQAHKAEMERLKVIERLIKDQKINPIAARCAVNGWADAPSVCLSLSGSTPTEESQ